MLSVSIPNCETASAFVETATKCLAIADSSCSAARHQSRALLAFVSVSIVVNVFDEMMKSVSSGSRSRVASAKSFESTFETKRIVSPRSEYARSASYAIAGPRSEPPIPMLTTARMRLPVCPSHSPERTRSEKADMRSSTSCTSRTTSTPSTTSERSRGIRRAVCRTARSSVTLMCSPRNIASRRSSSLQARASSTSRRSVSSVTRCFDQSAYQPAASPRRRSPRAGSCAKSVRRWTSPRSP